MSEQLIDGAANNWPKTLSKYTERYPTEESLPLITGMDFGHTCPTFTIPFGIMAEIDSEQKSFTILENAVIE